MFSQLKCLLLENYLLAIVFSQLPLSLHLLYLYVHLFFHSNAFLDLFDLLVEACIQLGDMGLGAVHILLIEGLEFENFVFLNLDFSVFSSSLV